jgi:putative ABC transport system substrate-binding protein
VAGVVDRILKGADPAHTPFMLPTRYRVVVNRKTAAALGLRLSEELVLRVDRWVD